MRLRLPSLITLLVFAVLLLVLGVGAWAWLARNPFPDGYQNEFLHVGNAFDLWDALCDRDAWHLRYYVAHAYWPPLFYAAAWPLLGLLERSRDALVLTNLAWLALALAAVHRLARDRFAGITAMLLFALSPGLFGTLVRFEPNVAQAACLGWGLLALHNSRGFRRPGWSAAAGLALAMGLLTDRLGTAPFLALPLLLALLPSGRPTAARERVLIPPGSTAQAPSSPRWRPPWRGLLLFGLVLLVLAGPWYLQWTQTQLQEVSSQLASGEIDSTGSLTELAGDDQPRWAYYLLVLLDSQAGPVLGLAMLAGLAAACPSGVVAPLGRLRRPSRAGLLVACVAAGWMLFSLVQKKQVFYTLPLLVPLSVLAGDLVSRLRPLRGALLLLLLAAGLHQYGWRGWGQGAELLPRLGQADPLPLAWVFPRHVLARPPSDLELPRQALHDAIGEPREQLIIFSEDHDYWEGFLVLALRELYPGRSVHGLTGDPQGSYEWFRVADAFVYVTSSPSTGWPSQTVMEQALESDHYALDELPPVVGMITHSAASWQLTDSLALSRSARAYVWKRR